jgi:hypothetical protein
MADEFEWDPEAVKRIVQQFLPAEMTPAMQRGVELGLQWCVARKANVGAELYAAKHDPLQLANIINSAPEELYSLLFYALNYVSEISGALMAVLPSPQSDPTELLRAIGFWDCTGERTADEELPDTIGEES